MGIITGMPFIAANTPRCTVTGIILLRTEHPQRFNQAVRVDRLPLQHEVCLALRDLDTELLLATIQGPKPKNTIQSMSLQQVSKLPQELRICTSPQDRPWRINIINKVKLIRHKPPTLGVKQVGAWHNCSLILWYHSACLVTYLPGSGDVSVVDEALGTRNTKVTVQEGNAVEVVDVSAEKEVSDGAGEETPCALIFKRLGSCIEGWE